MQQLLLQHLSFLCTSPSVLHRGGEREAQTALMLGSVTADSNSKQRRGGIARVAVAFARGFDRLKSAAQWFKRCPSVDSGGPLPGGYSGSGVSSWRRMAPWSLALLLALALVVVVHVDGAQRAEDEATLARLQQQSELQAQQQEEVRARLLALQASMNSIDQATKVLNEKLAIRESEAAQLRRENALVLARLKLCQTHLTQTADVTVLLSNSLRTNQRWLISSRVQRMRRKAYNNMQSKLRARSRRRSRRSKKRKQL
jgi:hypothetical protein